MSMHIKMVHLINEILLETLEGLKDKRIHLSKHEITQLKTVDPSIGYKPLGLYYTIGDLWIDNLKYNPKRLYGYKYIYEVIFNSSARIWAPKTYDDFFQITKKYSADGSDKMNFSKMSKEFDGMEIFETDGGHPYYIATSQTPKIDWIGELIEPFQGIIWNGNAAKLEEVNSPSSYLHQVKTKVYNPMMPDNNEYSHDDYIQGKIPRSPKWSNAHQSEADIEGNPVKWSPEQKCYLDWKGNPAKFGYVSPDDYKNDTFT